MTPDAQHPQRVIDYSRECPSKKKGLVRCSYPRLDCRDCIEAIAPTTAPAGHCEHECVCSIYMGYGASCTITRTICEKATCSYDTRSRPTPAPAWTDDEVMKEIEDAFDRGIIAAEKTIDMQRHDNQIRQQAASKAREQVLDDFALWIEERIGKSESPGGWDFKNGELLSKIKELRQHNGGTPE
jgi:hypothetical protein